MSGPASRGPEADGPRLSATDRLILKGKFDRAVRTGDPAAAEELVRQLAEYPEEADWCDRARTRLRQRGKRPPRAG